MGVPALFRWLSKKYPKIIYPVVEEDDVKVTGEDGVEISIPFNMSHPNPNDTEFDNLYLDMNGIVHPCTHPEGKPAPETEEEMMLEVFKYTERVVNMIRPRKLLFMAIDGVAPRAKMNQQRSRRFRSAQEAKDKKEAREESIQLWKAMGKDISEEEENKVAWDSNAITPGTPFMDLLAASLRYWTVQKINTDPGWKNIQVIISDASVPGEGEHKIMDFIRRQRSNLGHDPNTKHVIYGLDADLIMLALATHEPHFRVLREDVFNESNSNACRKCGQEGHYAAQCTGTPAEIAKKPPPPDKKPFIFLDVPILREYLEVELDVPQSPFGFDLEQAIDDWVLLIFFVGNDFLPHLPSLEIREGAIDTLLKIWKQELPRMGGYITNHGQLNLSRAETILEGLARREDEIFRRRREAEERQNQNAKRRKLEAQNGANGGSSSATPFSSSASHSGSNPLHPSLPQRPDFAAKADSIGLGAAPTAESIKHAPVAAQALAGSNHDVVANRRAIRMANMSAAEMLKAEMSGAVPLRPTSLPAKPVTGPGKVPTPQSSAEPSAVQNTKLDLSLPPKPETSTPPVAADTDASMDDSEIPGLGGANALEVSSTHTDPVFDATNSLGEEAAAAGTEAGTKRTFEEGPGEPDEEPDEPEFAEDDDAPPEADTTSTSLAFKVNPDGTVEQEDHVKLWEPGYRERYYRQKFGVELSDIEFRKSVVKSYIEGMAWVLHYYYQGTPSWQWFYPHHFAPFAADFEDIAQMDIRFDIGQPFKPFEQLMGVFPAASRQHIPATFHDLMVGQNSPIIDFYPETFEIDMNGKRMAWQGVALLPFIDEKRLLEAMKEFYSGLTDEERMRNAWGNNVIFTSDQHPIYPLYEGLYGKRKKTEPVVIDIKLSKGISGSVMPLEDYVPGSTFFCPLKDQGLPDIKNDCSLQVYYFFPKQLTPHRSVLLPGVIRPPRRLSGQDLEIARAGGRGRGRGGWDRGGGSGRGRGNYDRSRGNDPFQSAPRNNYGGPDRRNGGGGSYPPSRNGPPQSYGRGGYSSQSNYGGYGGGAGRGLPPPPPSYGGYGNGSSNSYNSYGGYGGYEDNRGYGGGSYGGGGYRGGGGYNEGGYGGGYGRGGGYGNASRQPPQNGYGGYSAPPPPAPPYQRGPSTRGRGRGW